MPVRAIPTNHERAASRLGHRVRGLAMLAVGRLLRWHELARQRRALLALDGRMLKDLGITRAEAKREASRPFWDDPIDPWSTGRR